KQNCRGRSLRPGEGSHAEARRDAFQGLGSEWNPSFEGGARDLTFGTNLKTHRELAALCPILFEASSVAGTHARDQAGDNLGRIGAFAGDDLVAFERHLS